MSLPLTLLRATALIGAAAKFARTVAKRYGAGPQRAP
jgi:hypothetical protein